MLAPGGVLVLCAVLCFYRIGSKSFWFDESISAAIARMGTGKFVHTLWQDEANMSLYYSLLRGWVAVGGAGPVWIRSLSVACGVGTAGALYLLARRMFGLRLAIVAVLVLIVNSLFVQYAQEARSYMLTTLLATLATYLFLRGIEDGDIGWWVGYAVVVAASIYGHLFAVMVPLGHVAALAFLPRTRVPSRRVICSLLGAVVLATPALRVAWIRRNSQVWWKLLPGAHHPPPITVGSVRSVFAASAGGGGPLLALAAGAAGLAAVHTAWRSWRQLGRNESTWRWALAISAYVLPTIGILAVSGAEHLVVPRYFSMTVPALALVIGLGLMQLHDTRVFATALAILVLLSAVGLHRWYNRSKENWRTAIQTIRREGQAGDAIVLVDPYKLELVRYYNPQPWTDPGARLVYPPARFDPFPLYATPQRVSNETLHDIAASHRRVWLLVSWSDRQNEVDRIHAALAASTDQRLDQTKLSHVTVELYQRQ